MFRGATKVSLDAKGRMAIPTRYRERLSVRCDGQIIVTFDKDHCLLVYPLPDWEELERKLVRLPSMNKAARRIVARFALAKSIACDYFLEKGSISRRDSATGADISRVGPGFARGQPSANRAPDTACPKNRHKVREKSVRARKRR